MTMEVTLLGTGTPVASLIRAGSSYLVTLGDERILVDCGPFSARRLLEAGVRPVDIDTVFLTHLHYDHCTDYGHLVLNRWDEGPDDLPDLLVYGPAHTQRMSDLLFGPDGVYGPDLDNRASHPDRRRPSPAVQEVEHGEIIQTANWTVTVAEVVHCQPELTCLAYRLDAGGRSIVFGGDSAPAAALTELATGADVLLHMCHFLNGEGVNPRLMEICSGHLDAARTARDAGVETLVLVHLSDEMDDLVVRQRMLAEMRQIYDGEIIGGEDLLSISLDAG